MSGQLINARDIQDNGQQERWDSFWARRGFFDLLNDFFRTLRGYFLLRRLHQYIAVPSFCEIGCGSAIFLAQVSHYAYKVTGIDNSSVALTRARALFDDQGIQNGTVIVDDCRDLKIEERFDTVWSDGVIEHFDDPGKIIYEHLKITKDGGSAVISAPYKYSYKYIWYILTRPKFLRRLWPWTDQMFFTKKFMCECFEKYCGMYQWQYRIVISHVSEDVILFVKKETKNLN